MKMVGTPSLNRFGDLKVNDTFLLRYMGATVLSENRDVYMKVTHKGVDLSNKEYAVRLNDGILYIFSSDTLVDPVKVELHFVGNKNVLGQ